MNTENKFEWTDELVREFVNLRIHDGNPNAETGYLNHINSFRMDQFKKSKQQKDWEVISHLPDGEHGIKIHSVKRISDGEVFSVGDGFKDNKTEDIGIIKDFFISESFMCVVGDVAPYFIYEIKTISKHKQPLFKTEDGVEMFSGMYSWYIGDDFKVKATGELLESDCNKNKLKHFSTKEKAENWVLMNKPVLSVNDVLGILKKETLCKINTIRVDGRWKADSENYDVNAIDVDKLKELAKSKIEGK